MSTVNVVSPAGTSSQTAELPDEIFDAKVNIPLIHQVVVAQQAAARQGTHATKTRGEVRGGGKKPYRQKGTGRARQGSLRAPQFSGGGISHGPQPRNYDQKTPKKMKAAALRGALSDRARAGQLHVVSSLVDGDTPSTKAARKVTKPVAGLFAGAGVTPRRYLAEVRTDDASEYQVGQEVTAEVFEAGQLVDATGTSKGKGTAGVMKRHGFKGLGAGHGTHRKHRAPGSIGGASTPGRVFKGVRMAGRMGAVTTTTLSLTVHKVDAEKGLLLIKGAVPGPRGGLLLVRSAVKGGPVGSDTQ